MEGLFTYMEAGVTLQPLIPLAKGLGELHGEGALTEGQSCSTFTPLGPRTKGE